MALVDLAHAASMATDMDEVWSRKKEELRVKMTDYIKFAAMEAAEGETDNLHGVGPVDEAKDSQEQQELQKVTSTVPFSLSIPIKAARSLAAPAGALINEENKHEDKYEDKDEDRQRGQIASLLMRLEKSEAVSRAYQDKYNHLVHVQEEKEKDDDALDDLDFLQMINATVHQHHGSVHLAAALASREEKEQTVKGNGGEGKLAECNISDEEEKELEQGEQEQEEEEEEEQEQEAASLQKDHDVTHIQPLSDGVHTHRLSLSSAGQIPPSS